MRVLTLSLVLLLFLLHCSPTPRAILDANTPSGAFAYLFPLFFPELKPSDSKAIKTFSVLETGSGAKILGRNITLTVPHSTDLSSLTSEFFQTGERVTLNGIEQISGETKNNYSSPLTYTVTAKNQTTQSYRLVTNRGLPTSNSLLSFSLTKSIGSEIYTGTIIGNSVIVYVPFGTDVSSLLAIFSHNGKSALVNGVEQRSGRNSQNFSSTVIYRIDSESETSQTYSVRVEIGASDSKDIKAFWLNTSQASLAGNDLLVPFAFGTDLSDLPVSFIHTGSELKIGTRILNNGESSINATNPVTITVLARDGSTKDYRLRVSLVNEFVTIGGNVSGLGAGLSLVLRNNGSETLTVLSNGSFSFSAPIQNGSEYNVSIVAQPVGQICDSFNDTGFANMEVNTVRIVCFYLPGTSGPKSFTDNRDGTILDNITRLVWQKCSGGQIWRQVENDCQGTGNAGNDYGILFPTWQGAVNYCNNLNLPVSGSRNWRLPTKDELLSLIDFNSLPSSINSIFPPPAGLFLIDCYWSSTLRIGENGAIFVLCQQNGVIRLSFDVNDDYELVRCVSNP